MERDGFTCQFCGDSLNTLNVHHVLYLPNKDPWEYEDQYLITVCETCHTDEERLKEDDLFLAGNFVLAGIKRRDLYSLASALRSYLSEDKKRFQNLMEFLYEG
jgi:hypothetical protein